MTPTQCKEQIRDDYLHFMDRVREGKLNESAVYGLVESRCREAARHNGVPEYWKHYLPEELT